MIEPERAEHVVLRTVEPVGHAAEREAVVPPSGGAEQVEIDPQKVTVRLRKEAVKKRVADHRYILRTAGEDPNLFHHNPVFPI